MNAGTAQLYARWIGALYVITIIAGGWGEAHVPDSLLIANDVVGTAHRVANEVGLFRASFVAYLLEASCDITLNVLLYAVLRPVSRHLALLALCFGLIATAIYAAGELIYFVAAVPILDGDVARTIPPDAKTTITYFCLTAYGYVNATFAVFYGTPAIIRGYLMIRSKYVPFAIGTLFIVGGIGFVCKNLLFVIAPSHDTPYVMFPLFLAMLTWAVWSFVRKIDRVQWAEMVVGLHQ